MNVLVTGAAGFIGSHLCLRLLKEGFKVKGIDCFTDFYPKWMKERNLKPLLRSKKFEFLAEDLNRLPLKKLFQKADSIFHMAAQAGVRTSWGQNFSVYIKNNIQVTQKILEAAKDTPLQKIINASSSSVYGLTPDLPMTEASPLCPLSPYGVTKLAAEKLCALYFKNYGIPAISLRFFTVYGPGQRPDMAFHKFFKAIRDDKEISVYGDGQQTRDFTFVDDAVEASLSALFKGRIGETYNIGGGHREKLLTIFPLLEEICQKQLKIKWMEKQKGDIPHTLASIVKAQEELNYSPQAPLDKGLKEEWKWIKKIYGT